MENHFENVAEIVTQICQKYPYKYIQVYIIILTYVRDIKRDNNELTFEEIDKFISEQRTLNEI